MTTTKPTPTYSSAPAICVHIDSLSATRFILPSTRQYPYRDALGRINLNLVNASLAEAEAEGAPAAARDKLAAWQRHASRALKNIPEDEKQTLDEIAASSEDGEDAQSSSGRETTSEEEKEPPKTTHATRRLFRLPNTNDEPHFDFDDEAAPEADRLYLGQLTEGQNFKRSRNASPRKKSTPNKRKRHATRNSLPLPLLPARRVALPLLRSPFPGANDDEEERSSSENDEDDDDEEEEEDSSTSDSERDVYEVEAILDEDESGSKGFLVRWAGYGPEHDQWEPEWNIAPHLVESFRKERKMVRRHQCDDYTVGRKRLLWCSSCNVHFNSDSFSANQRKREPSKRVCLVHHYKTEAPKLPKSSTTGAPVAASHAVAASCHSTPASSKSKRQRAAYEPGSATREPPKLQAKQQQARPVARTLSHRQAAMEVRVSRLFGSL